MPTVYNMHDTEEVWRTVFDLSVKPNLPELGEKVRKNNFHRTITNPLGPIRSLNN